MVGNAKLLAAGLAAMTLLIAPSWAQEEVSEDEPHVPGAVAGHAPLLDMVFGQFPYAVELPGTPRPTYELRYRDDASWPDDDYVKGDIEARIREEGVEFLSVDSGSRTIRLRTTRPGIRSLKLVPAEVVLVEDAAPELTCNKTYAEIVLKPDDPEAVEPGVQWTRPSGTCPGARIFSWLRNVLVEGVDAQGGRLFVVVANDGRWYHNETFDDQGRPQFHGSGKRDWPDLSVTFEAPVDENLVAIRVWELDEALQPKMIGELPWQDVEIRD
ncbi:MAG: hypothetical protein H6918_12320 [Sphingomonadaceae bacterium]|nr:hypothetical protein [Sphingomonadaceae bacterium]